MPQPDRRPFDPTAEMSSRVITNASELVVPLTREQMTDRLLATKAGQRYLRQLELFEEALKQYEAFRDTRPQGSRHGESAQLDLQAQLAAALTLGEAARKLARAAKANPIRQRVRELNQQSPS